MNRKNLVQTALALDKLNVGDVEFWGKLATHLLRIMHDLRSKDYYYILDVYDRPLDSSLNSLE